MRQRALARARTLVVALGAAPFAFAAIVALAGGEPRGPNLDMPAALAGLVALPVAWRAHAALLDRARRARSEAARAEGFVVAIAVAVAVTAGAATFGVVAHMLSREPLPLVGCAMHAILARLVWPSRDRLDTFLGESGPAAP